MTDLVPIDEKRVAQVANAYLSSFANQCHEPRVMLAQVRELLSTVPEGCLQHVCNPSVGAVSRSDRPCLKSLKKWIDDWIGTPAKAPRFKEPDPDEIAQYDPFGKVVSRERYKPPTEEERARVRQLVRKTVQALQPASKASERKPESLLSDEQNEAIARYLKDGR